MAVKVPALGPLLLVLVPLLTLLVAAAAGLAAASVLSARILLPKVLLVVMVVWLFFRSKRVELPVLCNTGDCAALVRVE